MGKQLLLIEGENGNLSRLQRLLSSNGYVVYLADTVQRGWEFLHSRRVDGILLSLDMLKSSDLGMLAKLRSQYPKIPVVAMSSSPTRKLVMEAFAGGVRGHISKPITQEQLLEALFIFEGHLAKFEIV